MPCLIALVVFSILGIFSATHRRLAKEAFDCVFRRITLRPCDTGFDTKVKAKVLGSLINKSPKVAKFVSKQFEPLAWIFAVSMLLSTVWVVRGLYNYWAWGSCNGLNQSGFCAFDPSGENNKVSSSADECIDPEIAAAALSIDGLDLSLFPTNLDPEAKSTLVLMGCYGCDYTRKTYPLIKAIVDEEHVNYVFIHFPTKSETQYLMNYDYCVEKNYPNLIFDFVDRLFSTEKDQLTDKEYISNMIDEMGMDSEAIAQCAEGEEAMMAAEQRLKEAQSTGIYGTPTVFIDGMPIVGPKPVRVYRRLVK